MSCSLANVTALSTIFVEETEFVCNLAEEITFLASRAGFAIAPVAVVRFTAPVNEVAVILPS